MSDTVYVVTVEDEDDYNRAAFEDEEKANEVKEEWDDFIERFDYTVIEVPRSEVDDSEFQAGRVADVVGGMA